MAVTPATSTINALAGQVPVGGPLLPEQPWLRGSLGGPVVGPDTGGYSQTYLNRYGGTVPGAWDAFVDPVTGAEQRYLSPDFSSGNFDIGSPEAMKAHPFGWNRPDQGDYTGTSYYDTYRGGGNVRPGFETNPWDYITETVMPRVRQQMTGVPTTDETRSSAILDALAARDFFDSPLGEVRGHIKGGPLMARLANQGLITGETEQHMADAYANIRPSNLNVEYTGGIPSRATINEELSEFPSWYPGAGGAPIGSIEGTILPSDPVIEPIPQDFADESMASTEWNPWIPISETGWRPTLQGDTLGGPVVGAETPEQIMASNVAQALATKAPRGMPGSPRVTPQLQALTQLAKTDPTIAERYTDPGSQEVMDITSQVESFANIPDVQPGAETPWTPPAPVIPDIVVPPPAAAPAPYVEQFEEFTPEPPQIRKVKKPKVKKAPKAKPTRTQAKAKAVKAKKSRKSFETAVAKALKATPTVFRGGPPSVSSSRSKAQVKASVRPGYGKPPKRPGGR